MEYSNKFIPDKDENKKYEATFLNFLESLFPNQVYLSRYGENAETDFIDQEFADALVIDAEKQYLFCFQLYKNQKGDFNTCKNIQFTAKKKQITRNYNHINKPNASIIIKNGSCAEEIEFKFNNIKVYYFIIYEGYEGKMISDFKKSNEMVDGGARMKNNFFPNKIANKLQEIKYSSKNIDYFIDENIEFYKKGYYFDIENLFIDHQKTTMIHVLDKESWEYKDTFSMIVGKDVTNKLNIFSVYFDNKLEDFAEYLSKKEDYFKNIVNNKISISIADERSLIAYYKLYVDFPKKQIECLKHFTSKYSVYMCLVDKLNHSSQIYYEFKEEVDRVKLIYDAFNDKKQINKNKDKNIIYILLKDVDVIKIQPAFDNYFMVLVWLKNKYPQEFDDTV